METITTAYEDSLLAPEGACQRCKINPAEKPHGCPYQREILDSDAECNCCLSCESDCAMEV